MRSIANEELTAREYEEYNQQKEMWTLQSAHAKEMKLLDIEIQKLEVKWSSWVKLPLTVIKLPVMVLCIIPLSIYAAKKVDVPEQLWKLLK